MPRRRRAPAVLVTCEHGGNRVPREYAPLFRGAGAALRSHRGWDPGALRVARVMSRALDAPLLAATVTRLLVDLNRSLTNPRAFSEFSRDLEGKARDQLVARYYAPHRERVEARIDRLVRRGTVIHVGVHSFTPVLRGQTRRADIGLLYDPGQAGERALCRHWARELRAAAPALRLRMNYPYRGVADGLTTVLRRRYPGTRYLGIELELNQSILRDRVDGLARLMAHTLTRALAR